MNKRPYSWLLFDADGTLFDYDAAEAAALAESFSRSGLSFDAATIARYRVVNRFYWNEYEAGRITQDELRVKRFAHLLDELSYKVDPALVADEYLCSLSSQRMLLPGALELIELLSPSHRLLLITNGIPDVQRGRLRESPLRHHFEQVIISGEVGVAKPDPGIFDIAFKAMGGPSRRDVMIIGDSLASDIAGGLAYGIDTCWYCTKGDSPPPGTAVTHQVSRLADIGTLPRVAG